MTPHANRSAANDAGFSLVELAIVLLVIGLIMGGILKGQELLESARLKSLLTQVNEYRVATSVFLERYGSLPGDYDKAKEHILDTLKNGNGDGIILGDGLATNDEALSFWSHLAAANLIASPGNLPTGGSATFGKGAPVTKMGGGFTIQYNVFGENKHWFVIGKENGNKGDGALLTPLQALSLDQKIDSGNPTMGHVRARDGANTTGGNKCIKDGMYNTAIKTPACVMYFMM